jgi:hypothetical protein
LANLPEIAPRIREQKVTRPAPAERQGDDLVRAIMRQSVPITEGTAAWLYLWTRALPTKQPGLLAHPSLYCHEIGKPLPALIAPLTNGAGEVCAVQRIWLSERMVAGTAPDSRAALAGRKKTLGQMYDSSVQLAPAAKRMGVAEGVETALAAAQLYRMAVWASCGAARLASVWIPPECTELWVFGDRGDAGEKMAERADEAQSTRSRRCGVIYPDAPYDDFNTMLRATAR